MLNQSTAIILSTLLGGLLTIVGGFIASYFTFSIASKREKWKELRNVIEKIYKTVAEISLLAYHGLADSEERKSFGKEEFSEMDSHMTTLRMLIVLYVPSLQKDYDNFRESLHKTVETKKTVSKEEAMSHLAVATGDFHRAIIKLVAKRGYNYL